MPPEAAAADLLVTTFLDRVERRAKWIDVTHASAIAILLGAGALIGLRIGGVRFAVAAGIAAAAGMAGGALAAWRRRARWNEASAATLVERTVPESRNVVFTARELLDASTPAAPWVRRRVVEGAARILAAADPAIVVPIGRKLRWLVLAALAVLAIAPFVPAGLSRIASAITSAGTPAKAGGVGGAMRVVATVAPPGYVQQPERRVVDPASLEVMAGGRVTLTLEGGSSWSIRFGSRTLLAADLPERRAELVPTDSGYFAIEHAGTQESRLIPLTVTPDRAPTVRIETPGKDLLLPAAQGQVALSVVAADDYGLADLSLSYTKVSGSGEQFEFTEGALPLNVSRASARAWKASASFDLPRMKLEPGDSIVYRAVARDARPGGVGSSSSDTYFVEIAGPGQVALPGFELPPDRERYALSQQMILLKLQRLRARESTLSREDLTHETDGLGAEQRAVRANFIFLMGGSVEDEEEEAAHSNEIQEGRLENSARREISTAIRFMGEVETALGAVNTAGALPPAKSAVEALQRAFGRNRYFLKTLAERSRIDPSRRLTGDLKEAGDWRRLLEPATDDPKSREARLLLARLLDLAPPAGLPPTSAAPAVGRLAEEALAIDPASAEWQTISASLTRLRDAIDAQRDENAIRTAMRESLAPLLTVVRKSAVRSTSGDASRDALRSAWIETGRTR